MIYILWCAFVGNEIDYKNNTRNV